MPYQSCRPVKTTAPIDSRRKNTLYVLLCGIFLTNALLAEIIGVKIFSVESLLGMEPAHIPLLSGFVLDFNLTAGALIWPVVFVTSDVINEYFGPAGVKRISCITAGFILYSFFAIYLTTLLPPAQFWLEVNRENGLDINFAFGKIFRQGLGIITGSLTAFLVGQVMDAYVFQYLRRLTQNRFLWLRATGSTVVSQLADSFLVLWIAFYVFGNWTFSQVLAVGIINYIYKFVVAVGLTPLLYIAHSFIDRYLAPALVVVSPES